MSDGADAPAKASDLARSSLVHELRQPLFALRGRLQVLHSGGAPVSGEQFAELMEQLDHVEALLTYYSDGNDTSDRGPFDVRKPVREVLSMVKPRAEASGIVVCADLPEQSALIEGSPTALRQVLANLLQNAMDAVSPAQVREIVVRVAVDAHNLEILIEDSGVGVPAELRPRLFEPFVTTKPPGEGTGLGLFISQRRAHELGGSVTLEPGRTGGTHARVVLPLSEPAGRPGSSGT